MNNMYACMVGLIQPVAGADPAGGWVTLCMNLFMYIYACTFAITLTPLCTMCMHVHTCMCIGVCMMAGICMVRADAAVVVMSD